jgi:hypothetical protein
MRQAATTRRRFLRGGVGALIVGLAGCSGDGGDSPSPTEADSPSPSATGTPTSTGTATLTGTSTDTATPTATDTPTPTSPFTLRNYPGESVEVRAPEGLVGQYMYGYDPERRQETYKTYLHVADPATGELLTSGPTGQFDHHRGIFIGWDELTVDGSSYDFWHLDGGERMVHRSFDGITAFPDTGRLASVNAWIAPGDETVLEETREMTFRAPPTEDGIVVVDVASTLEPTGSEVQLLGDPEHAGIQYRPHNDVAANETARYVFPAGTVDDPTPGADQVHAAGNLSWVGQSHTIRGETFFVQHMNHPDNPEDTIYSAYRPYGRFGAFFEATIPGDGSLTVRYRFLVRRGEAPDRETLQGFYDDYAG